MIWLIIVIVGLIIYFTMNKNEKREIRNNTIPRSLRNKMANLLFGSYVTEDEKFSISREVFELALKFSNKNLTYDYLSNSANILQKPELLHYAGIFNAIKDTINSVSIKSKELSVHNKEKTVEDTLKQIINSTVVAINNI